MPWYRLTYQAGVVQDLAGVSTPMAQRLLEKTKWIASNVENLRHESIHGLPRLHKYAVGEWRIFYAIDPEEAFVEIHAVIHRNALGR
ncbi:MAG TPA: type II toxin-antitoxin system RelE/ParE family toxin [Nitrospira sp.]|jgi:mRNA interferase RelE/StbE|nr:type II toxin-antitoxin system RelE/ParE family toxin [Nitrospira sp.]